MDEIQHMENLVSLVDGDKLILTAIASGLKDIAGAMDKHQEGESEYFRETRLWAHYMGDSLDTILETGALNYPRFACREKR